MTYAEAHLAAMAALDAVSTAGHTALTQPGTLDGLKEALALAQSAMDALATAEQMTPPLEAPKLLEMQARWERMKAHWGPRTVPGALPPVRPRQAGRPPQPQAPANPTTPAREGSGRQRRQGQPGGR